MKRYVRHIFGAVICIMLGLPQLFAQQINYAEYFFDIDPGFGNGTAISISQSDSINTTFNISTASLNPGLHTLYVRTQSTTGQWSLNGKRTIYIDFNPTASQYNITKAEYFFNSDPGYGNANSISLTAADIIDITENISTAGLNPGINSFYLRVKNGMGLWSPAHKRSLYITDNLNLVQITAAEYFFDNDPGLGNATSISISQTDSINSNFAINTSGLNYGLHNLFVRVKDANGNWSICAKGLIYISRISSERLITSAEYYFDDDPGHGNGTQISISPNNSIDINTSLNTTSLSSGLHNLYIRIKDDGGNWSLAEKRLVYIAEGTSNPDISQIEYFFNDDPGFGNANQMSISSGSLIDINQAISSSSVPEGINLLHIRAKDTYGRWSLTHKSLVYVAANQNAKKISALEYTIDTILPIGQGTRVNFTPTDSLDYNFSFAHGIIDTNYHTLFMRIKDQSGNWSLYDSTVFRLEACVIPTAEFTISDICFGDTIIIKNNSLDTDTMTVYEWDIASNGVIDYTQKDSIHHYFNNSGTYDIFLKVSNYVCIDTITKSITVNPTPTANITAFGTTTFCPNGTVVLSSNTGIGYNYQWIKNGGLISNANSAFYQASDTGDYQVAIENIYNCSDTSNTIELSHFNMPSATININGSNSFCDGDSAVLQANTFAGLSYEWYKNGNIISGETSSELIIKQSGNYYVKIFSTDGCSDISSDVIISVNPNPIASISAAGATTFCEGNSVTFYASNGPGYTFKWLKDNSVISSETSSFLNADSSGNYSVIITNNYLCSDTSSSTNVVVNDAPNSYINNIGSLTFCQGDSTKLFGPADNSFSYQWLNYGTNISAETDSVLFAKQSGNYTLKVTNSSGCTTLSNAKTINVNPNPGASVIPLSSTSFCDGDSVILQANVGNNLSYQWYRNSNAISDDTLNQNNAKINGSYFVEVTNEFNCSSTSSITNVNVYAVPTSNFTIDSSVCANDTVQVNYTGSASSGAFYNWNFDGATVHNGNGQGPYQISWNSAGMKNILLSVSENACVSIPNQKSTLVNSISAVISSANTSVCAGDSIFISANSGNNFIYQWLQAGVVISGENSNFINVSNTGNYQVEITDTVLGCSQISNSIVANVFPTDFSLAFTANNTTFTQPPFDVNFANNTPNMSSYQFEWDFGDGNTSQFYQPFHNYQYNGDYTVVLYAENVSTGCKDTLIKTDYISCSGGSPNPCNIIAAITPAGPATICNGDSVMLTASAGTGYTYQWARNGMIISGADSIVLWAKQSGNYRVIISDSVCSQTSNPFVLNHYPSIQPQILVNGSIQPCTNDSLQLYLPTSYINYNWSTGDTISSIYVNQTGYYTVSVTDHYGCNMTSQPETVNASFLSPPQVCIVGVDSNNNNRIIWERPVNPLIDSIYIYRESVIAGQYDLIGTMDYDDIGVFSDVNSNPAIRSYRYRLAAKDTCDAITLMSTFHKTIHLTINAGLNGSWNLIWDGYSGFQFGSYRIYRGTSTNNMSLLTQLPSTSTSYTDLNPPVGTVYYQIEVIKADGCYPDSVFTKANTNYNSSRSNMADNGNIAPIYLNADFTANSLTGQWPIQVSFTDISSGNPTSWKWSFGDGNSSIEQNPKHTYNNTGLYDVKLIACNGNVCDTTVKQDYINVLPNGMIEVGANLSAKIYPNPNDGSFTLEVHSKRKKDAQLFVYNNIGQLVYSDNFSISNNTVKKLDLSTEAKGVYFVHLSTDNGIVYREKVVVQ